MREQLIDIADFLKTCCKDEDADLIYALAESSRSPGCSNADIPPVLFDGFAVYSAMDAKAKQRTGSENVSDVLDAVVRLLKKEGR